MGDQPLMGRALPSRLQASAGVTSAAQSRSTPGSLMHACRAARCAHSEGHWRVVCLGPAVSALRGVAWHRAALTHRN